MKRYMLTSLLTCAMLLTGCVERSEKVKVRPDGQATVTISILADQPQELSPGRAPSQLSGWNVDKGMVEQGKKVTLTAEQTFAPGHPLPANDATPGDLLGNTYVQFPTTIKIEKRSDGTYYQFRRVYQARPYAWLAYIDDRPGHQDLKSVMGKPVDKVTQEEWEKAVTFGIQTQVFKKLEQARAAVVQLKPELPQDKWLTARQKVLDEAMKIDTANLVAMLKNTRRAGQGQQDITRELQTMEDNLDKSLVQALTAVGATDKQIIEFKGRMNQYKSQVSATNDARATVYKISVDLPGQPVGSNGTLANGTVTWEIKGEAFSDRDVELLATSKVR